MDWSVNVPSSRAFTCAFNWKLNHNDLNNQVESDEIRRAGPALLMLISADIAADRRWTQTRAWHYRIT